MFDASGVPVHFGLTRSADATVEWATLSHAKGWLKVDDTADDEMISALIAAVRNKVETDTRRAFLSQTWTYAIDGAPANREPILFPVNPVISVTSVTSYDTASASSVVATSVYRLDSTSVPARLVLKDAQDWPTDLRPQNGIEIVFAAGFGTTADTIPAELHQACRLLLGHWYANREAVQIGNITSLQVPLAYDSLIAPYKVAWL